MSVILRDDEPDSGDTVPGQAALPGSVVEAAEDESDEPALS